MTRKRLQKTLAVLGAAAALAGVATGAVLSRGPDATGGLQDGPSAASQPPPASAPTSPAVGGKGDGIEVHGRWTIEVRSAEGALVSRSTFENELTASGRRQLAFILGGRAVGQWAIRLFGRGIQPCARDTGRDTACVVTEADTAVRRDRASTFPTLRVTNPEPDVLMLEGTATAENSTVVERVRTSLGACSGDTRPADCDGLPQEDFTDKRLSPTVDWHAGQQLQVTVEFSFS